MYSYRFCFCSSLWAHRSEHSFRRPSTAVVLLPLLFGIALLSLSLNSLHHVMPFIYWFVCSSPVEAETMPHLLIQTEGNGPIANAALFLSMGERNCILITTFIVSQNLFKLIKVSPYNNIWWTNFIFKVNLWIYAAHIIYDLNIFNL